MASTSLQDRVTIQKLARAGCSDRTIAESVHWQIPTVRKWRRIAQAQGSKGLLSHMGRPATGRLSSFDPEIGKVLRTWRQGHPGWGPQTLRTELEHYEPLTGHSLPARASLAGWLEQEGLTRPYQRHQELSQPPVATAHAPHEEWEVDARGHERVPDVGVIALLNVNDVFSKVKLLSYPCWLGEQRATRHPTTEDYQLVFRWAMSEWGRPDCVSVDHDSIFYDNRSKSPFPTRFHLWLLALGIALTFGRMSRPTDQATTERSHQTWYHQVLEGQRFATWQVLWDALNTRRRFLNECLPCATWDHVPPLIAHPEVRCPRRGYRPEWERELLDLTRVHTYLAQGRWFRKASNVGTVSLGQQTYVLGRAWAHHDIEITFDPTDQGLVFKASDGETIKRLPIRGIGPSDLMGELAPFAHLDRFQLALPFSWNEWRVLRLSQTLGDTT